MKTSCRTVAAAFKRLETTKVCENLVVCVLDVSLSLSLEFGGDGSVSSDVAGSRSRGREIKT